MEETMESSLEIRNSVRKQRLVVGHVSSSIAVENVAGPIWSCNPSKKLLYRGVLKSPSRRGICSEVYEVKTEWSRCQNVFLRV